MLLGLGLGYLMEARKGAVRQVDRFLLGMGHKNLQNSVLGDEAYEDEASVR
jgi:hypothetical protein